MDMKDKSSLTASEIDSLVGERIRRRRILTGQTQDQLGDALGVSYQQIQKYETGANRVSAGRLFLLAEKLDVAPAWFFDGIGSTPSVDEETELVSSSRLAIECVKNLSRIQDEKVRGAILTMIRTLADSETDSDTPSMAAMITSNGSDRQGAD
ncbi:MAG: helix-turn-helix transcriptional regulator [Pseudomonadota bacterium]|nr:helix-turn-helix transcriptional regulator [Pseudomonadota bacterium]